MLKKYLLFYSSVYCWPGCFFVYISLLNFYRYYSSCSYLYCGTFGPIDVSIGVYISVNFHFSNALT
jgi:hypothetical protein